MSKAEYKKTWYERNKPAVLARTKLWYEKNRARLLERAREYGRKNKKKVAEAARKRRQANKERDREKARAYYLANQERLKAKARMWSKTPEGRMKRRLANQRRRLRIENTDDGTIVPSMILAFLVGQKMRCALCDVVFKGNEYQIDHIKPLSKGGAHSFTNMQLLCKTCNGRKSDNESWKPQDSTRHSGTSPSTCTDSGS